MKVFHCVESPGDHMGIADFGGRIVIVIVEHGAGAGDTETTAHLIIDPAGAYRIAMKLWSLRDGEGEHGAVDGLWIAETMEEHGFMLSIGDTDVEKRSVILSWEDTRNFCTELWIAATGYASTA